MARARKPRRKSAPAPAASKTDAGVQENGADSRPERYVWPIFAAVLGLVLVTAATTDQWRGAWVTSVQLVVVAGAAWWGLRR